MTEEGIEIQNGKIVNESSFISIKQLPASVYILRLIRLPNEEISYPILKVN